MEACAPLGLDENLVVLGRSGASVLGRGFVSVQPRGRVRGPAFRTVAGREAGAGCHALSPTGELGMGVKPGRASIRAIQARTAP